MEYKCERYYFLDALRGIAVINMVLYHFLYDVYVIFGGNYRWFLEKGVFVWEFFICSLFILISGIVWNMSKNRFKRGIVLNICGGIVTFVTVFFIPEESIWFGILTFLGCAAVIMIPVDCAVKKINPFAGIFISILFFMLTYRSVIRGYVGLFGIRFFDIPEFFCNSIYLIPFGFPCEDFHSSDYFPLFPWFFMYLTGYFLWKILIIIRSEKESKFYDLLKYDIPVLGTIGRKSLLIYIIHQPVCFGIAYLISR